MATLWGTQVRIVKYQSPHFWVQQVQDKTFRLKVANRPFLAFGTSGDADAAKRRFRNTFGAKV